MFVYLIKPKIKKEKRTTHSHTHTRTRKFKYGSLKLCKSPYTLNEKDGKNKTQQKLQIEIMKHLKKRKFI